MPNSYPIKLTINSQQIDQITENLALDLNLSSPQFPELKSMVKQQVETMFDDLLSDLIASPSRRTEPCSIRGSKRIASWRSPTLTFEGHGSSMAITA